MKYSIADIIEIIEGEAHFSSPDVSVDGYSIDSRSISSGDLFFAVKGESHDGHSFVENALSKGAAAAVVRRGFSRADGGKDGLIHCEEPLEALHRLAAHSRKESSLKVIGITGSCGKTTTKDITAAFLGCCFKVSKNYGNYNNIWGMPLELLRRPAGLDFYICEMGMSFPGELSTVSRISRPDIAVFTNVNAVHLMNFKSVREIAEAKAELLQGLAEGGTVIANFDDPEVMRIALRNGHPVITFGLTGEADVSAQVLKDRGIEGMEFLLRTGENSYEVRSPLPGYHNLYNVLAAATIGIAVGADTDRMLERINDVELSPLRNHIQRFQEGWTLFNDSYNSNPESLKRVLATVAGSNGFERKIAVLGDMLELGTSEDDAHRDCGRFVAKNGMDALIALGPLAGVLADEAEKAGMSSQAIIKVDDSEHAFEALKKLITPGSLVLIKGSRGMKMEKIVAELERSSQPMKAERKVERAE